MRQLKSAFLISASVFTLAILIAGCASKQDKMPFKNGDLIYDKTIPTAFVKGIGDALVKDSFFLKSEHRDFILEKPDSIYVLKMGLNPAGMNQHSFDALNQIAMQYSEDILGGAPLDIAMQDSSTGSVVMSFHYRSPGTQLRPNGGRFFYSKAIDATVGNKLKDYMVSVGYFVKPLIIAFDKQADGYHAHLISDMTEAPSQKVQGELAEAAKDWSVKVLGGAPVTLDLCTWDWKSFCTVHSTQA